MTFHQDWISRVYQFWSQLENTYVFISINYDDYGLQHTQLQYSVINIWQYYIKPINIFLCKDVLLYVIICNERYQTEGDCLADTLCQTTQGE